MTEEDDELVKDFANIIHKHGLESGNFAHELAEYLVRCLEANGELAFYRMERMVKND